MKIDSKAIKTFPLKLENELHKRLKIKATEEDLTLHEYIVAILEKVARKPRP